MTVGETATFAIECEVSQYDSRPSLLGMGHFIIHLGSLGYGVKEPDATMLACSFDAVARRIAQRGRHTCDFSSAPAADIVAAVDQSRYLECNPEERFWGMNQDELNEQLASRDLLWAPDGDAAFDDGSNVLQFDVGQRVRLVGFKRLDGRIDTETVRDIWIDEPRYYEVLTDWLTEFRANWIRACKQ